MCLYIVSGWDVTVDVGALIMPLNLQMQLAEVEQSHSSRLLDLTSRHRAETEMEVDRLRGVALQAERTLEARERAHRQRVKGLEEQVLFHSCVCVWSPHPIPTHLCLRNQCTMVLIHLRT